MVTLRANELSGTPDTEITTANSAAGGDAFTAVSGGPLYTADGREGGGGAYLPGFGIGGYSVLEWSGLGDGPVAVRAFVRLDDPDGFSQDVAIRIGAAQVRLTTGFGSGVVVETDEDTTVLAPATAIPFGTWMRIEATAAGDRFTGRVFFDASSDRPSCSGVITRSDTFTTVGAAGRRAHLDQLLVADAPWPVGLLRVQSCGGPPGTEPVAGNSSYGDAWGAVDAGITYTADGYAGPGLRLPGGATARGVAWNSGFALGDFAVRGHLRRDEGAEDGHVAWANTGGGVFLTSGGGLSWAGLELPAGAVPAGEWVRVEVRRSAGVGHLEVFGDPQATTPTAAASGMVPTDLQPQWWWERYGTGGITWDELALADTGDRIGPITLPEHPGYTGFGLPMFAT
ncbi:hypothetical protein [Nocardiopsis trehalosi]|uniref:hypothetical protein n=1 Tax=Nocardiopsis trehalosi TaxID=109329 RepID=UPI00082A890D|nr:hypothetical protein [Nocardiopsis trehalosi]